MVGGSGLLPGSFRGSEEARRRRGRARGARAGLKPPAARCGEGSKTFWAGGLGVPRKCQNVFRYRAHGGCSPSCGRQASDLGRLAPSRSKG